MKKINFLKSWLMLVMLLVGVGTMWAETYTGTVSSSSGNVSNSFTLNGVSWNITTTAGSGSPSITYGNAYSQKCIKFGSGASNCFGSVSLSTDYFKNNNKKVTKVEINALGSAKKNVTFSIGTSTTTQEVAANAWTKIALDNLNVIGTLKLDFALNSAGFFISQVVVTYETNTGGSSQYSYTLETVGNGTTIFKDANGNTVAPNQKVNSGTKLKPTFTPDPGYEFTSWEYYTSAGAWSNVSGTDFTITKDVQFRVTYSETQSGGGDDSGNTGGAGTYNITPNNALWGTNYSGTATGATTLSGTSNGISITLNKNNSGSAMYVNDTQARAYSNYTMEFTAPTGHSITAIKFTADGANWAGTHTADVGTMTDNKNWTGEAENVTITFKGTCRITDIAVTLKSNGPAQISNLIKTSSANLSVGDEIANLKTYLNLPNDYTGTVTFTSVSNAVEIDGNYLLATGAGEATINVTAAANGNYLETTGTITLNISKKTPVIAWEEGTKASYTIFNLADNSTNLFVGQVAEATLGATVQYRISGTGATIEDGLVSITGVGAATITAYTEATNALNAAEEITYTLNIVEPSIAMTPADGKISAANNTVTFTGNGVAIDYLCEEPELMDEKAGTNISVDLNQSCTIVATITDDARNKFTADAFTIKLLQDANLSFSEPTQTVSMDDEPFAALALTKLTNAPVTYSLDIRGDEGAPIASINTETGVITLSKTKATTATRTVYVVATTEANETYAAGEARYQLLINKRNPNISWSADAATVDIEGEGLPTLSNPRGLTITYSSTNTEVADFVDGNLVLKTAGTTTIKASIGNSAYYDATFVSYELTFAPRYTVTFKVNGQDDVVLREATSGAGVTPPSVGAVADYTFAGWTSAAVATETTDAQTFATITAGKYMPTNNTTELYAVYQRVEEGDGSSDEGEFLIYANVNGTAHYMADKPTASSTKVNQITSTSVKTSAKVFTIEKKAESENEFAISYVEGGTTYYLNCTKEGSGNSASYYLQASPSSYYFTRSNGTNGSYRLTSTFSGQIIAYRASTYNVFKMYKNTNPAAGSEEYFDLELEHISGGSTTYYTSVPVMTISASISDAGMATFTPFRDFVVPSEESGVKVYYASSVSSSEIEFTQLEAEAKVKAGEGLLLKGAQNTYNFNVDASDEAVAIEDNQLIGVTADKYMTGVANAYILAMENGSPAFCPVNGGTLKAGKAYLVIPSGSGAPLRISFATNEGQTATSLENLDQTTVQKFFENGQIYILKAGRVYNVSGQFVR